MTDRHRTFGVCSVQGQYRVAKGRKVKAAGAVGLVDVLDV